MEIASCAICASPHRSEIEKKDIPGKSTEAISWARKQGINISKFSLAKHRANHLGKNVKDLNNMAAVISDREPPSSSGKSAVIPIDTKEQSKRRRVTRNPVSAITSLPEQKSLSAEIEKPPVIVMTKSRVAGVSDTLFLDTVRDMVYQKLLSGEMELKLESGFKAIEIKSKIAEESQNEKLLLEILSEIRSEELKN